MRLRGQLLKFFEKKNYQFFLIFPLTTWFIAKGFQYDSARLMLIIKTRGLGGVDWRHLSAGARISAGRYLTARNSLQYVVLSKTRSQGSVFSLEKLCISLSVQARGKKCVKNVILCCECVTVGIFFLIVNKV